MYRVLLTNDDGIGAPGLDTLQQIVASWSRATVVAPSQACSGCGHQSTTDRDLLLSCRVDGCYHVDGSPVDCIRLGLLSLEIQADWVLSGINDGANLGVDVFTSGTVAAVREAALLGKPAIAISQYRRGPAVQNWKTTAQLASRALDALLGQPLPRGAFWNVNLPDVAEAEQAAIVHCPLDPSPLPVRYRQAESTYRYAGAYHQRQRIAGSDVDTCLAGNIAVSRVTLGDCFAPWATAE